MARINSFELKYLGNLYQYKANEEILNRANDHRIEIINFLENAFYQELNSDNFISLKAAAEQVLRWCTPELHSSLQGLGLTNNQIAHIHGLIIGQDGNVFGHSLNIFELAQAADFPLEMLWAAIWHDLGEIGLYFKVLILILDLVLKTLMLKSRKCLLGWKYQEHLG
jgi:hypothetical protein